MIDQYQTSGPPLYTHIIQPHPPPPTHHPQGAKALLVGFPGGRVCTEQHIPGYVAAVSSVVWWGRG
jgi:hypothetical protein